MLEMKEHCMAARAGALTDQEAFRVMEEALKEAMETLRGKKCPRILLVPPDITRCCSYAGKLAAWCYERLQDKAEVFLMPATGTHRPMTRQEQRAFFGKDIRPEAYLIHDWQKDTVMAGTIPASYVEEATSGRCSLDVEVEINRLLLDGSFDLVISLGQVVPHEVVGMANYTKNILVGLGGRQIINKSHMIGAACNLETIMGNVDTPVRKMFDYAEAHFLSRVPLMYVLTVTTKEGEETRLHGIFAGSGRRVFEEASALAKLWNITYVERRARKVVAYLDPEEFTSFWVGNKAVYRTRMIVADGGELLVIAPGLAYFGENEEADRLIRTYGYRGTPYVMRLREEGVFEQMDMVAAHMIHSSPEGRFQITYAVNPKLLTREEIEAVGYGYMDYEQALKRYPIEQLEDGWQQMTDGEEIYVVKTPALGVWKTKEEVNR